MSWNMKNIRVQDGLDMEYHRIAEKYIAKVLKAEEEYLINTMIDYAYKELGVTKMTFINGDWLLEAIKEKMEREQT